MKRILPAFLTVLILLSGCMTKEPEQEVSRLWEMQETGHYIFESNNPNNIGLVSHKGWSGFHRNASLISLEYSRISGGRGLVFGLKLEVEEDEFLPLLSIDHKGRYNFLDIRTHRPLNESWEKIESYEKDSPLILTARREGESWNFYIGKQLAGSFPGSYDKVRYGVVLYTSYGNDRGGAATDFPKEKIHVEIRILEEN